MTPESIFIEIEIEIFQLENDFHSKKMAIKTGLIFFGNFSQLGFKAKITFRMKRFGQPRYKFNINQI